MQTFRYRTAAIVCVILLGALVFAGCAGRRAVQEPLGPNEAWQKAMNLFQHERYSRARDVLRDIALNYSGSGIIDSAQFYLGRCSFELEEYLTAADEFHRVNEQYPSSALGGAALYYEARSYYEQAPAYPLDQEFTNKALAGFQRFLEEYPTDALSDSGYHYLASTRAKLARKVYQAAILYFDLREYASAVLYSDVVLDNYYDTPLAESAQFLKGRSFYALKSWDRAREQFDAYLEKYPSGQFAARARDLRETAARGATASAGVVRP